MPRPHYLLDLLLYQNRVFAAGTGYSRRSERRSGKAFPKQDPTEERFIPKRGVGLPPNKIRML